MMRLIGFVLLAGATTAAFIIPSGCDNAPDVPQAVIDESNKPADDKTPKRPTTQELVSGNRTRAALIPLPLTMEMPDSWGKLEGKEQIPGNHLRGHTPSGEVLVQLSARPSMKQDTLDRLIEGAKKEMAKNPAMKLDLRPLGEVKLLERQLVGPPRPYPVYNEKNEESITTESIFNWTLSVLVPHEGALQVYELNFIGLTKNQYDKDKEFLQGILSTLQYGGEASASPGATPPSAPSATDATTAPAPLQ
ncbi:MAG: hypothetical protein ABIP55_12680 [Tepidisphaeraceae bacterium]